MNKLTQHFKNNKAPWITVIVLLLLIAVVIAVPIIQARSGNTGVCQERDIYNLVTGELCPGKQVPVPCAEGDLFNMETGEPCPVPVQE